MGIEILFRAIPEDSGEGITVGKGLLKALSIFFSKWDEDIEASIEIFHEMSWHTLSGRRQEIKFCSSGKVMEPFFV